MNAVNGIVGRLFDLVLAPFGGAPAWGMAVVSVLSAVWALLLFRAVTPQAKLAAARDRLVGHLYEMGLYQDRLRVVARIQRDLAAANLRYLATSLPALLAMLVPMALTLGQLEARYERRPLAVGESAVVAVTLAPSAAARLDDLALVSPPGVTVEAGPVRDRAGRAAAWRLRADAPGRHALTVTLGGVPVADRLVVAGDGLPRTAGEVGAGWTQALRAPGEPALAGAGAVSTIRLRYPQRSVRYLGVELHWLAAFAVLSLAGGLALKDLLKVEI